MATYSVIIRLDNFWVDNFNNTNMKLCMAKATKDGTGKEVYNVIAKTSDTVQPTMTFTWTDEYKIEATTTTFSKGGKFRHARRAAKIEGTAGAKDIGTGQTYNIQTWTKTQVYTDSQNVNENSFGFANSIPCSIMLSMKDGSKFVPVYISPETEAPGMSTLTPIPKVVFWFQKLVESSTMIVNFVGANWTVTPIAGHTSTISYNKQGVWSQVA
ncbi:hypothetical protein AAL_07812 [Moelleriella libera RCEF 2490]|uniref:Uncharacterized protein n=1 Tax=Moelleriella libera RCEF 2490 TaxID=1081109 RepID=A0A167WQZ5_9HYPO|nr:hypothetical protein AAL_07812 [Moelleriella libera RCEF 2490]